MRTSSPAGPVREGRSALPRRHGAAVAPRACANLRIVVAGLVGELGVDVDDVVRRACSQQLVADQDLVERPGSCPRTRRSSARPAAASSIRVVSTPPSSRSTRLGELEVVDVAEHDDVRLRRRRRGSGPRSRSRSAPAGAAAPRSTATGGWKRPNSGSSPPLELKWLAMTKHRLAVQANSPASGLRLSFNAGFGGSIRPGLSDRCARPCAGRHVVGVVDVAAGSVDERQAAVGAEQEPDPDVAARLAAVLVVDRVDLRGTRRPARRRPGSPRSASRQRDRRVDRPRRWSAPLLSWISSIAIRSGERRLVDDQPGERGELRRRVAGSRFSTLNVATASSFVAGARVTSRARPPSTRVSAR